MFYTRIIKLRYPMNGSCSACCWCHGDIDGVYYRIPLTVVEAKGALIFFRGPAYSMFLIAAYSLIDVFAELIAGLGA